MSVYAYQGEKPYIFISYAHKDAASVLPILSRMEREGYRFWYDEGIDPGSEWDENIAGHIVKCSYVIAFVSASYLASSNCKDEINYARDLDKPRLLIYLEDVALPHGMAMRMNRLQSLFYHKYDDKERFFAVLAASEGIGIVRDAREQEQAQSTHRPALSSETKTVTYENGDVYEGTVSGGVPHGYGVLRRHEGGFYRGDFVFGQREGQGLERYPDGNLYDGAFQRDQKHGKGVFHYSDGDVYEGMFREGHREGEGILTDTNGCRYRLVYEDGRQIHKETI